MKVLVALDSFKGTLSAARACALVAAALHRARPDWRIAMVPMADGGDGTAAALVAALNGGWLEVPDITGPLPDRRLRAAFGWFPERALAVVEMARASGLTLLEAHQRNPMCSTTLGTGELLRAAADHGARDVLLTLGGSATVDGGTGAARALGWRFLDRHGDDVPLGGASLKRIAAIVAPPPESPELPSVKALCDVDNPLCGPRGAAAVYGPQKGATPEMVAELEAGLLNLAHRLHADMGMDVAELPGSGAAGGFGAGAVAFFGARLVPGFATVAAACGLPAAMRGCDWVVTGEGMFDGQSLQGKVVSGVLGLAAVEGARVAVLAGRVVLPRDEWLAAGVAVARPAAAAELPDNEAFGKAAELLDAAAFRLAEDIASA